MAVYYIRVYFLCHLHSDLSQNSFRYICFTFISYLLLFLVRRRVCCASVPGTLAFDLPTLIHSPFFSLFRLKNSGNIILSPNDKSMIAKNTELLLYCERRPTHVLHSKYFLSG